MPTSNPVASIKYNDVANSIVLKEESKTTFLNLLEAHIQKLQPANPVEAAVVEEMVADFWRLSRRYTIDLARLDSTADTSTTAESAAAESRLLASYEVRLRHKYNRSLKNLQMLRSFHPTNQPQADPKWRRPNEPRIANRLNCQTNLDFAVSLTGNQPTPRPNEPKSAVANPGSAKCETNPRPAIQSKGPRLCETNLDITLVRPNNLRQPQLPNEPSLPTEPILAKYQTNLDSAMPLNLAPPPNCKISKQSQMSTFLNKINNLPCGKMTRKSQPKPHAADSTQPSSAARFPFPSNSSPHPVLAGVVATLALP